MIDVIYGALTDLMRGVVAVSLLVIAAGAVAALMNFHAEGMARVRAFETREQARKQALVGCECLEEEVTRGA